MTRSILITQCLQNDFVKPLGRYDALPNVLHVGFDEARRLLSENPLEGPVARTMQWAYRQPDDELLILHIRDWHDPDDPFQAEHFRQFGSHCVVNTTGAQFAFPVPDLERPVGIINSPGLNDFVGTSLADHLPFSDQAAKVGLIGVWTEAKITFLAYDLRTRYPDMQLAVCSALTASSSRARHFSALEQLERLLGVAVYSSIGEFTRFLSRTAEDIPLPVLRYTDLPKIVLERINEISDTDRNLIRYLFRDCRQVQLRELSGGFSGNLVLGSESMDLHGHQQVPHVVKIGPQGPIGQERAAFEQIEGVLGNNAPRITEFADSGGRGALKYRYAAMGGGFSTTFQKRYCSGLSREKTKYYLTTVFGEQLGRFYNAATLEQVNLLEYYWFKPDFAPIVRESVENVLGGPAEGQVLHLPTGQAFPNLCLFYEHDLAQVLPAAAGSSTFSYIPGDLNGANIIIDDHDNVWLIDFFHTHRGHILKDLIKLENDLLYIFTPVEHAADLVQALRLTDCLLRVEDLGQPLPDVRSTDLTHPEMRRAYETVRLMRSFYPALVQDDRDPLQLLIGQLRYAAHTLSFSESNAWQKQWALYTAGWCSAKIAERLRMHGPLRIDWLDRQYTKAGRLGLTILPGRRDRSRSLADDIAALKEQGVSHVVPLLTDDELGVYGVDDLLKAYQRAGFVTRRLSILDQKAPSLAEMDDLVHWLNDTLAEGANVMTHCVGGLGRSGMVAACYLTSRGLDVEAAIDQVRRDRSPRAVESTVQEAFIRRFADRNTLV